MSYREICRILGVYLFFFACFLIVPIASAIYYEVLGEHQVHSQGGCFWPFLVTMGICLVLAGFFRWCGRKASGTLYRKEGLAIVVLIWFITAFVGALPFWLSGTLHNPLDAYFESMSGLTTTGATVMQAKEYDTSGREIPIVENMGTIPNVTYTFYGTITPLKDPRTGQVIAKGLEAVGRPLLLWRSFLQWIGGMGIVVLFLAVLPALGVGGKVLYQAEVPGPVKEAMTPRIRETASLLWKLYIGLTALEVVLLWLTNAEVGLFDATCIAFSNISTGGFAVRNGSIGAYKSPITEWIVVAFMLVGSISFVHYVNIMKRKVSRLWEPELLVYFLSLIVGVAIVIFAIVGTPEILLGAARQAHATFTWSESLRYGAFQLISCQTSTGFATADYNHWPFASQVILLTVMFIGGMSGSTAGGVKVIRYTMLVRIAAERIESIFRPNAVRSLHIGTSEVGTGRALTVLTFFFIIISLTLVGTFLLVVDGLDPETALTTIACMVNNIGLAFRAGGPAHSFAFLPSFGKVISVLWMVMGRLEFFAVLLLLLPGFWRSK